tara:strand:- start:714 stop:1019 length:306 start_codon:yes stop_codon:yes gene_type:complete
MDKIRSLKANAFDGVAYQHERDFERLKNQAERILDFISDGEWTTLREISAATGAPEGSVSSKLRDLRKAKYGGHTVDIRYAGNGVYQYRFIYNSTQETLGF